MWDWFIWFLKSVLEFFANTFGDWGLAVIILTVIIRLALTPLTIKSTKSSAKMQALQPKLQEIQELYADDPQKQTEELQKFYREQVQPPRWLPARSHPDACLLRPLLGSEGAS